MCFSGSLFSSYSDSVRPSVRLGLGFNVIQVVESTANNLAFGRRISLVKVLAARSADVLTGQSTSAIEAAETVLPNGAPVRIFETGVTDENQTGYVNSLDAFVDNSGEVEEAVELPRASLKGKEVMVPSPVVSE